MSKISIIYNFTQNNLLIVLINNIISNKIQQLYYKSFKTGLFFKIQESGSFLYMLINNN